jgi:hypothetical protein
LGCETSRLPHILHNRLTDGGEVVSLTRRPVGLYPPQVDSWFSFRPQGPSAAGRIRSIEKCNDLGSTQPLTEMSTRNLPGG